MNILDTLRLARAEIHNPGHARDRGLDVDQILQEALNAPETARAALTRPAGLQAFPAITSTVQVPHGLSWHAVHEIQPGMELRDAFAIQLLAQLLADDLARGNQLSESKSYSAEWAYEYADAAMRARARSGATEAAARTDQVDTYNAGRAITWEGIADKLANQLRVVQTILTRQDLHGSELIDLMRCESHRITEALDAYDEENVPF